MFACVSGCQVEDSGVCITALQVYLYMLFGCKLLCNVFCLLDVLPPSFGCYTATILFADKGCCAGEARQTKGDAKKEANK